VNLLPYLQIAQKGEHKPPLGEGTPMPTSNVLAT